MIEYPHTLRIVQTRKDGYGSEAVLDEALVPGILEQATGFSHGNYQSAVTSDAVAAVDPANAWVRQKNYRLEGMLLVAERFGGVLEDSFYRIINVEVGMDHQLGNEVDNVRLSLKKSSPIQGVS